MCVAVCHKFLVKGGDRTNTSVCAYVCVYLCRVRVAKHPFLGSDQLLTSYEPPTSSLSQWGLTPDGYMYREGR